MEKFELNIGLNNNKKTVQEIMNQVFKIFGFESVKGFRIETGQYQDEPEETLVIAGQTENTQLGIITGLACLADNTTQECIAVSCETFDLLVYQTFWTGKRIKFEEEYFIRYEQGKAAKGIRKESYEV